MKDNREIKQALLSSLYNKLERNISSALDMASDGDYAFASLNFPVVRKLTPNEITALNKLVLSPEIKRVLSLVLKDAVLTAISHHSLDLEGEGVPAGMHDDWQGCDLVLNSHSDNLGWEDAFEAMVRTLTQQK